MASQSASGPGQHGDSIHGLVAESAREPLRSRCPLCAAQGIRLFERNGYWISACARCAHRYAEIGQTAKHIERCYGDDYFFGGGAGFPDYLQDAEPLRASGRRYAQLLQGYCWPGRVLDVGAAAGFLLEPFLEQGWRGSAIEPNQTMAEQLHRRLACPVLAPSLETFDTSERFDLVLMIQVVPHFVDPCAAFKAAATATADGGYWLIETWDCESTTARLFGRHWHEYSPPTVLHWFTPARLARFAARFGFESIAQGSTHKYITAAHAKSLLRYRLTNSCSRPLLSLVDLIPDRLALPYPGNDLFWMLLRKGKGEAPDVEALA